MSWKLKAVGIPNATVLMGLNEYYQTQIGGTSGHFIIE
jgi:hypothetical protein